MYYQGSARCHCHGDRAGFGTYPGRTLSAGQRFTTWQLLLGSSPSGKSLSLDAYPCSASSSSSTRPYLVGARAWSSSTRVPGVPVVALCGGVVD
eukprot:488722-Rhodomonas_salina.4